MQEKKYKLPSFIFDLVKVHRTSLGDNKAFPLEEDVPFDYWLLKDRFIEVSNIIEQTEYYGKDERELSNILRKLIQEAIETESNIKPQLEKIANNVILKLFDVPESTVEVSAKLVSKIKPKAMWRIKPEPKGKRKFDFEDIDDFKNSQNVILKRRLINSLIQGASYSYSHSSELFSDEISKVNNNLFKLYKDISIINDYLLFVKEEKITDKNPMQGGCVDVTLGNNDEIVTIEAQGLIFPFLLQELIKGFFELFASHGLPQDNEKAQYIINRADFLIAEPWDLRMGVRLWDLFSEQIENTKILPYLFSEVCSLPLKEFNPFMQEVFSQTKKGKRLINDLIKQCVNINDNNDITIIQTQDTDRNLISDAYLSIDDLDGYITDYQELMIEEDLIKEYHDQYRIPFEEFGEGQLYDMNKNPINENKINNKFFILEKKQIKLIRDKFIKNE